MKKILALLLAVVMVMSMAACAKKPAANEGANGGAATTGPVTLKVWGPSEDQGDGGWLLAMEEEFKKANPDLDITFVNEVCSEGDAQTQVVKDPAMAGDVYMFANDQLGSLINAGAISKLGGTYAEQVRNDNPELLVNTVTYTDGEIYGFPVTNNTWFMYYNKDVFSEEDVKSLNTMLEKGVVAFQYGTGWYSGSLFFANGGTLFGDGLDAAAGIQFGAENGGYEAAKAMVDLAATGKFKDDANGLGIDGMKNGVVHAFFSGSWDAKTLQDALGDKLGAVQPPMVEIGGEMKQMMSFAGSKAVAVNPHSANAAVATKFAAFLASVDAQKARFEMRGVIPCATVLANEDAVKNNMIAIAEINTMANCAVIQPVIPEMSKYWNPVGQFGGQVAIGEVNADNYKECVDQMMEQLNSEGL